ncbi:MAG: arsenite methyltransferase [Dehalococcoidia bacterium]|nr:arsenite methyltransferase [Dehalococcoidia bacterium]
MKENGAEEIKRAVAARYGAHARKLLDELEASQASCCGPAEPPTSETSSCACGSDAPAEADLNMARHLYSSEELKDLPEEALVSLGCGNPMAIAELREGERVLDLGSGGGLDCFLAARQVGRSGLVYGLDMSVEMVQLARRNAERVGAENVRFWLGEMEQMPFPSNSFDVIISNCVINLSPDKDAVLRECFRVLRPGGRLRVSDIVWTREPSEEERSNLESWTACVAGALTEEAYVSKLRAAGFQNARVERKGDAETPVGNLFSGYIAAEKARG